MHGQQNIKKIFFEHISLSFSHCEKFWRENQDKHFMFSGPFFSKIMPFMR